MNFLQRLIFLATSAVAIGLALWFSVALLAIMLVVGGVLVVGYAAKQFLISKGILNPRPGVPMETPPHVTVIETEYKKLDTE